MNGKALKMRRVYLDMSQRELAAKAGTTAQTISLLERGISKSMKANTLLRLANVFGISAKELVCELGMDK